MRKDLWISRGVGTMKSLYYLFLINLFLQLCSLCFIPTIKYAPFHITLIDWFLITLKEGSCLLAVQARPHVCIRNNSPGEIGSLWRITAIRTQTLPPVWRPLWSLAGSPYRPTERRETQSLGWEWKNQQVQTVTQLVYCEHKCASKSKQICLHHGAHINI